MTEKTETFTPFTMSECETWLDDIGIPFEYHTSVYDGLIADAAKSLLGALPLQIILDTAYEGERSLLSESWHAEDAEKIRALGEKIKEGLDEKEPAALAFVVDRICAEIVLDRATLKAAQWLMDVATDHGDERMSGINLRRAACEELAKEAYDIAKGNEWLVHLCFVMECRENPDLIGRWHSWKSDCNYHQSIQDGMEALKAWQASLEDKMPSPMPEDEDVVTEDPLGTASPTTTDAPTPEQDIAFSESITDSQIANMQA